VHGNVSGNVMRKPYFSDSDLASATVVRAGTLAGLDAF